MSKTKALATATRRQNALNKAESNATAAATMRDAALYDAQQAGATYLDLQNATGLSSARVTQILRRIRHNLPTT